MSLGEVIAGRPYNVVDENVMRLSAFLVYLLAATSSVIGFAFRNFELLPYLVGFVWLNFAIGLFIHLNYAPTVMVSRLILGKNIKKPIGAIQKKFAWGLGFTLATIIFTLSLFLVSYPELFNVVCMLCMICLALSFFEAAFKMCAGCELYAFAQEINLIPTPKLEEKPNCMGDSCKV